MSRIVLLPSGRMIDLDAFRSTQRTDQGINEWGLLMAGAPPTIIDVKDVDHIRDNFADKTGLTQ